jgi:vacuolar-type H+-ATPase subunit F/Vma7
MEKIYVLGDLHTVSAFRLAGVEGRVTDPDNAATELETLALRPDAAILLITNDLAWNLRDVIIEINLKRPRPVILEIPGIDDEQGFRRSAVGYISEALGISL